MRGIVTKSTGSWYEVECEDGLSLKCRLRGRLRLEGVRTTNPLAVGDIVTLEYEGAADAGRGVITALEPRRNYIIRRSTNLSKATHIIAANIDCALLVVSLAHPTTSLTFIDRFLATAEAYSVPAMLAINKIDLLGEPEDMELLEAVKALYESLGYPSIGVSAHTGEGLDELREVLCGKTTLFSGNSGVGKTSLINALVPGLDLRTGQISEAHDTGMHTTSSTAVVYPSASMVRVYVPGAMSGK